MTDALEMETLWAEFHRVVNMTSQEIAACLRIQEAAEGTGPPEEGTEAPTGEHVLAILQKRRTDLTDADIRVMYEVVETVTDHPDRAAAEVTRDGKSEHTGDGGGAGDAGSTDSAADVRRRRLMAIGHDPLRAGV
ncbi:DUF3140 domain-containing protein [Streptomyces sp. NPDC096198]|uniref:DUF3140 domain-containing protein n=1 Tax=Streptomyces sp. NPDC096198 TaxID=3366080 RepID=UPI0038193B28